MSIKVDDLVIWNNFDRPYPDLIVLVIAADDDGRIKGQYVSSRIDDRVLEGLAKMATKVQDFGVRPYVKYGNELHVEKGAGDVTATYPDGRPRQWQPWGQHMTTIKPEMVNRINKLLAD